MERSNQGKVKQDNMIETILTIYVVVLALWSVCLVIKDFVTLGDDL